MPGTSDRPALLTGAITPAATIGDAARDWTKHPAGVAYPQVDIPTRLPERAMEIDQSIVRLGAELDAWWDEYLPMLDSGDRAAQGKALLHGFDIAKRFDRLKAEG